MKSLALLLFFSFLGCVANAITIQCDSNKNIIAEKSTEADCSECDKLQVLKASKEVELLQNKLKEKIKISYPLSGPNKVVQSSNYDIKVLKNLIESALANDIDPYLLLSIVLLENPPLIRANDSVGGYESGYGDLPLDAFPLYDMLGCVYKKPKDNSFIYATDSQVKKFNELYVNRDRLLKAFKPYQETSDKFRAFIVKQTGSDGPHIFKILETLRVSYSKGCPIDSVKKEISDQYCKNAEIRKANELNIESVNASNELENKFFDSQLSDLQKAEIQVRFDSSVAAAVVANKSIPEYHGTRKDEKDQYYCSEPRSIAHGSPSTFSAFDSPKAGSCCAKVSGISNKKDFLNFMAAQFVKSKIKISNGSLSSLSLDIQRYNGLGVIGKTEGLENQCLSGLNMKLRPYYGARAADLIVNSLLSNEEVKNLVQEVSQNFAKPISSVLCQKLGAGIHQIENNQFLTQQKDFLLSGRPDKNEICKRYFK